MRGFTVLCWDIDGTLLTTARAGIYAVEAAVAEVCGVDCDLQRMATAGMTDVEVAGLALSTAGDDPEPDRAQQVLRAYERHLPDCLSRRQGRVLDGIAEALADLDGRAGVASILLTGNTQAGAVAKLRHYGLDRFFVRGGAFCEGPGTREDIAARAVDLAGSLSNGAGPPAVFVIGDTPRDVACGVAVGARTIAVASGVHSLTELAACDPWLLLERIPAPDRFRRLLGLAA